MPYDHRWYNEDHTIIHVHIYGNVTWDGWHALVDEFCTILETSPQHINVIMKDDVGMPKGNAIAHMRSTSRKLRSHSNFGRVYIISEKHISSFSKAITNVSAKLFNMKQTQYVDSEEEAVLRINSEEQAV